MCFLQEFSIIISLAKFFNEYIILYDLLVTLIMRVILMHIIILYLIEDQVYKYCNFLILFHVKLQNFRKVILHGQIR